MLLENVVPGALVRGKYNKLTGAPCPMVPENRQPAVIAKQANIRGSNFIGCTWGRTGLRMDD